VDLVIELNADGYDDATPQKQELSPRGYSLPRFTMFQCVRQPKDPLGQHGSGRRGCSVRRTEAADADERLHATTMEAYR
jgi:hypothetical protein